MKKKKIERKVPNCLNCGKSLTSEEHYCGHCGQENTDNNIQLRTLLGEFFSNYFSFDSRFANSLKPFFLKPGLLTNEFLNGKRVRYANPVRIYLIVSLFHFYLFSLVTNMDESADYDNINIFGNDNYDYSYKPGKDAKADSIVNQYVPEEDLKKASSKKDDDEWNPISEEDERIINLMKEGDYSLQEIYDSLQVEQKPFWDRLVIKQTIKVERAGGAAIGGYIIQNIPLMIFLILPVYALLLKLFFYRKGFYIKHLVHTLHIHSFFFTIMTFGWILVLLDWVDWWTVTWVCLVLITVYIALSFRRVYSQRYIHIILKILGIGILYSQVLGVALIIETIISFAAF